MDNLTHSLVGFAAAKAGLERLSPAATSLCVVAANAPDADILSTLSGRWAYLQYHRGITHSIIGTLALAVVIPVLFWLGDRVIALIVGRQPRVKFRGLLFVSLVVSATHPILDWTNNYGIRPMLPWNGNWYYGDLVFIVDPWLWLSLGGACFLLTAKTKWRIGAWSLLATILTLVVVLVPTLRPGSLFPAGSRVVWIFGIAILFVAHRVRLGDRWPTAIPLIVFALIVVYWGGLAILHRRALAQAEAEAMTLASARGETLNRVAAMPVLANPMRWQCVFDTNHATYRFDLSLSQGKVVSHVVRYEKPEGRDAKAFAAAAGDPRTKVFLGFARFPVMIVTGDCLSETLVQFADLRYTEPGGNRSGAFTLDVPIECPNETEVMKKK